MPLRTALVLALVLLTGAPRARAEEEVDPWIQADRVLGTGDRAAALAVAQQAPAGIRGALVRYVQEAESGPQEAATRLLLARATATEDVAERERLLVAMPTEASGVPAVEALSRRAEALGLLDRDLEAAAVSLAGAVEAERIGWFARAVVLLGWSGGYGDRAHDLNLVLDRWERLLRLHRAHGEPREAARALADVGVAQARLGSLAEAFDTLTQALLETKGPGVEADRAHTLGNRGLVLMTLGRYPEAFADLEGALDSARSSGDPGEIASAATNLAEAAVETEDSEAALRWLSEAERIQREANDAVGLGWSLLIRSNALRARLDRDQFSDDPETGQIEVLDAAEAALDDAEKSFREGKDRQGLALALAQRSEIAASRKDGAGAVDLANRALELTKGEGALDALDRANLMWGLAHALEKAGRLDDALVQMRAAHAEATSIQATELVLDTLSGLARIQERQGKHAEALATAAEGVEAFARFGRGLPEGQAAGARSREEDLFGVALLAAWRLGDKASAFRSLEEMHARSLLEALGGRTAVRAAVLPGALLAVDARDRAELAAAEAEVRRERAAGVRRSGRPATIRLASARARWEATLQKEKRESRGSRVVEPTFLVPDQARGLLDAEEVLVEFGGVPERYLAYVLTPTTARVVDLGPRPAVGASVRALSAALVDPKSDPVPATETLRRLVVEPLALPGDAKRVLVSPDAALLSVPFSLLFPDREVAYVPSASVYAWLRAERRERGKGVLALGNPRYELGRDLLPLPDSEEEAKAVAGSDGRTLLGEGATKARLLAALGEHPWRAVHLACHGVLDPHDTSRASLALAADATDSGDLTALEVFGLEARADLVVLSACETGKGRVLRGQGLAALPRAFLHAGAPAVVVSLWKVEDEATGALMKRFYERWNPSAGEGIGAAAALKEAQQFVRSQERWHHPMYWAAWVLWGLPK